MVLSLGFGVAIVLRNRSIERYVDLFYLYSAIKRRTDSDNVPNFANKVTLFDAGNCSENDCAMLVNFEFRFNLWISLCTTGYKVGFCCGMQQTVILIEISGCGQLRTPYNAHP
ncbi:hypothetical protein CBW58_00005, partial [Yersinia frederiksenii]